MAFNPSRISLGPNPCARSRWYVGRLMLLRKQNSGTVYAIRSTPLRVVGSATFSLLFSGEAAHEKQMGASRRRRTTLRQRKTPTFEYPAVGVVGS